MPMNAKKRKYGAMGSCAMQGECEAHIYIIIRDKETARYIY